MSPRCAPIGFCPLGVVFCACFLPRLWACYTARIPWEIQKGQGFSVHHFPCSSDRNGSSSALYTSVLNVGEGGHSDMNYFTGHDRHWRHSDVVALKRSFPEWNTPCSFALSPYFSLVFHLHFRWKGVRFRNERGSPSYPYLQWPWSCILIENMSLQKLPTYKKSKFKFSHRELLKTEAWIDWNIEFPHSLYHRILASFLTHHLIPRA